MIIYDNIQRKKTNDCWGVGSASDNIILHIRELHPHRHWLCCAELCVLPCVPCLLSFCFDTRSVFLWLKFQPAGTENPHSSLVALETSRQIPHLLYEPVVFAPVYHAFPFHVSIDSCNYIPIIVSEQQPRWGSTPNITRSWEEAKPRLPW